MELRHPRPPPRSALPQSIPLHYLQSYLSSIFSMRIARIIHGETVLYLGNQAARVANALSNTIS